MATFNHISGAEPSTVTFKAATVTQTRNSSVMHQEIISIGDPESSLAILAIRNATPASTAWGMVTRPLFSSTHADQPVQANQGTSPWVVGFQAANISTSAQTGNSSGLTVRPVWSSSNVDQPVSISGNSTVFQGTSPWVVSGTVGVTGYSTIVSIAAGNSSVIVTSGNSSVIITSGNSSVIITSGTVTAVTTITNPVTIQGNSTVFQGGSPWTVNLGTNLQSSVAGSSGSSGLLTREIIDTILTTASSNAFTSSGFTVQSSGAGLRSYVTAYSITSTVMAATKVAFYSGSTMTWPVVLAAVSSGISGVNLACSAPAYLFRNKNAAAALTLQTPSSLAGFKVAVSYFRAP